MSGAVFFGCTFIAFGPALSLFLFTIAREPLRVILLIGGAFFWLVSLLLSSVVWMVAVQLSDKNNAIMQKGLLIFGVIFSVLLQELIRFGYYKLLKKANEGLLAITREEIMPISVQQLAYAFMTLAIILLHVFWGIVSFDACEKSKWWALAAVVLSHLVVSSVTFVNPQYEGSLIPVYIITLTMGIWAFFTAGGSVRNLKLCVTCRDKDFLLANQRPR
ncbi:gamma-secretase subunit Aph-1b isoform X2 [Carcharodon carcharias]|uniref:gamma-secretase subunit Aph-1b isoform X2 n=1 Tax=Carcharodon carcharias TaxID=13397 RepID=UPI001B7E2934|nr:gamma-secretase subunit Aph-1b isoform X2 [Carcharodon carcharias]